MDMRGKTLFTNFVSTPYFTKQDLLVLGDKFSIPETSINTLIQRSIKSREIISLKRGLYVTKDFFLKNQNNLEYKFFIANILIKSSYISRESAMQYYGLLSEATLNYFTSTTIKLTRKFRNSLGIFEYRNIKDESFSGYKDVKFLIDGNEYSYLIAEPYKAIFDYLYYRTSKRIIPTDRLMLVLDELRINYHDLETDQLQKLINAFK
jgi:predicted transcriptional regulator of viral defense system